MDKQAIKRWAWSQLEHMKQDGPKLTLLYLACESFGRTEFSLGMQELAEKRGVTAKVLASHLTKHPLDKLVEYTPGNASEKSHFKLLVDNHLAEKPKVATKGPEASDILTAVEPHWDELKNPGHPERNSKLKSATFFHELKEHGTEEEIIRWWKWTRGGVNEDGSPNYMFRKTFHTKQDEKLVDFKDWLENNRDKPPERDPNWLAARNHKVHIIKHQPEKRKLITEEEVVEYDLGDLMDKANAGLFDQ